MDPFFFGLTSFTLILSASMLLFELVRAVVLSGMPLHIALQLFIFRLPSIVVYIFPMATLLASLLAFSRLSGDSEVIALKAGGISLYRIIIPVLFLGLTISIVNLLFYEIVVPESSRAAQNLLVAAQIERAPKLQENVFVPELEHGALKRIFYARKLKGNIMEGVIVQEFTEGKLNQLINAKSAEWQKNRWLFRDGIIYILSETGEYKHLIKFDEQYLTIKYTPADFYIGDRKPEEMNFQSLKKYIDLKKKMGVNTTDLEIQLHLKIAIPFACLVFALLGSPLGISPQRRGATMGLGLSILVIFFYYLIMFFSMAAGEMETIAPIFAAWLPNLVTGGVGVYILRRAAQ
jgi:lipopolysaccharide export system permease protein